MKKGQALACPELSDVVRGCDGVAVISGRRQPRLQPSLRSTATGGVHVEMACRTECWCSRHASSTSGPRSPSSVISRVSMYSLRSWRVTTMSNLKRCRCLRRRLGGRLRGRRGSCRCLQSCVVAGLRWRRRGFRRAGQQQGGQDQDDVKGRSQLSDSGGRMAISSKRRQLVHPFSTSAITPMPSLLTVRLRCRNPGTGVPSGGRRSSQNSCRPRGRAPRCRGR